jgi:hypothetical protein
LRDRLMCPMRSSGISMVARCDIDMLLCIEMVRRG